MFTGNQMSRAQTLLHSIGQRLHTAEIVRGYGDVSNAERNHEKAASYIKDLAELAGFEVSEKAHKIDEAA